MKEVRKFNQLNRKPRFFVLVDEHRYLIEDRHFSRRIWSHRYGDNHIGGRDAQRP